ncbi:MAG: diguanylate cyclase [Oscillospiraceae bacterium]
MDIKPSLNSGSKQQEQTQSKTEFEILAANIPGGVYRCEDDDAFTIISVSGGFLSMLGYTRQEIKHIFKDEIMNMIFEADKESIREIIKNRPWGDEIVEFEYRIQCKNEQLMWVLDRGRLVSDENGEKSFFCMLVDITKRKEEREQMRLMLERHKVIMDQATDIIFEWDLVADTMDFSANWQKRFGYAPLTKDVSRTMPKSSNIHPEDMTTFQKLLSDAREGKPYSETEFRLRSVLGDYTWCRIRSTTQYDRDGKPIKAVGVIVDIGEEKTRRNLLLEAAQRDALTGLYNKIATKLKIENILADSDDSALHALMIIDVDNFKGINDTCGHLCGDAVLSDMSQALKKLFRSGDIVGRIGGDEFLVFLPNIGNRKQGGDKAQEITSAFSKTHTELGAALSCSIGISFYPDDGTNFLTLCHFADAALYWVKHNGKSSYAFYEDSQLAGSFYSPLRSAIGDIIESEAKAPTNDALAQYTFRTLYNSGDMDASIQQILQMVGRRFDVSRVYIFEISKDGLYCSSTFEWCNEGIMPEMERLQNLSLAQDLEGFFDLYDDSGVFYCQDVQALSPKLRSFLEMRGVVAILQCFIKDGTDRMGYIGFDECVRSRYWTQQQIDTLLLIADVLSAFITKKRLKEKLERYEQRFGII